jgi:hypothetical protein
MLSTQNSAAGGSGPPSLRDAAPHPDTPDRYPETGSLHASAGVSMPPAPKEDPG